MEKSSCLTYSQEGGKQCLEISCLLIKLLNNVFTNNKLVSPNQSGFRTGDSSVNQFLAITHKIYKSVDDGFEMGVTFWDTSKTLRMDPSCHTLSLNDVPGNLLNLLRDFFYIVANNEYF